MPRYTYSGFRYASRRRSVGFFQHAGDQHEGQGGEGDVEEGFADAVDQEARQEDGVDFLAEGLLSPIDADGGAELEEQEILEEIHQLILL